MHVFIYIYTNKPCIAIYSCTYIHTYIYIHTRIRTGGYMSIIMHVLTVAVYFSGDQPCSPDNPKALKPSTLEP